MSTLDKINREEILEDVIKQIEKTVKYYRDRQDKESADFIENQLIFFKAGILYSNTGKLPEIWVDHVQQLDPEWSEYERLKKKFGNR